MASEEMPMTCRRSKREVIATKSPAPTCGDGSEMPVSAPNQPTFRALGSYSSVDRLAAIYALRMIEGARIASRMINRGDICDQDLLALVGLEMEKNYHDCLTVDQLRTELSLQRRRLEARGLPKLTRLDNNIARVARAARLGKAEADLLRFAVIVAQVPHFVALFGLGPFMPQPFCRLISHAIGHASARLEKALGSAGNLRRLGLLDDGFTYGRRQHLLQIEAKMATLLVSSHFDDDMVLRHLLRTSPPASLSLDDYPSTVEIQMFCRYVQKSVAERRKGVNLLIHGAPGTGKTEFVRTLARALGTDLNEVPNEDSDGDAISGKRRFRAFSLAQNLLSMRRRQLLLFDEVEDVFGLNQFGGALFGFGNRRAPEEMAKGWINQTLENNPIPTIWVCNRIDAIDPAHLRRFDLTLEFRTPTHKVRRRIVERHFPEDLLSVGGKEALATMEHLSPAQVQRAARVVHALNSSDRNQRDKEAERAATLSLRAMGLAARRRSPGLPPYYDAKLLNTDRDLAALARGLAVGRNARLCFYGPPGTGKTAFAHHLATVVDKPLHAKRASDLISMWVGGTEKNLANAFRAASDEDAILLIDEADSYLQDRGRAHHSWEVSGVNEMLAQMEAFDGIFIASTNLVDSLDAASLRRFDFKIRFDYLTRQQRVALLCCVTGLAGSDALGNHELRRLDRMDLLVPGDVANVLRQLRTLGEAPTPARLLDLLEGELRIKPGAPARAMGV